MRRIRQLEAQVSELSTARRLESASIGSGGIRLAGGAIRSSDFDGTGMDDPGSAGFWISSDGAVLDRVVLREGSISAEALSESRGTLVDGSAGDDGTVAFGSRYLALEIPSWAQTLSVAAFGVVSVFPGNPTTVQGQIEIWGAPGQTFVTEAAGAACLVVQQHLRVVGDDPPGQLPVSLTWSSGQAAPTVSSLQVVASLWRSSTGGG